MDSGREELRRNAARADQEEVDDNWSGALLGPEEMGQNKNEGKEKKDSIRK